MPGHRKFSELTAGWPDERRERVDRQIETVLAVMELQELARERGLTQEDLAGRLDLAQGNVSRTLRRTDMRVSTLGEVVSAMGGKLEIVARFPDRGVRISQFESRPGTRTGKVIMAAGKGKGKSETTSPRVAKIASKVLNTGKATQKQAQTLAGSALTNAANKSKGGGKKK